MKPLPKPLGPYPLPPRPGVLRPVTVCPKCGDVHFTADERRACTEAVREQP